MYGTDTGQPCGLFPVWQLERRLVHAQSLSWLALVTIPSAVAWHIITRLAFVPHLQAPNIPAELLYDKRVSQHAESQGSGGCHAVHAWLAMFTKTAWQFPSGKLLVMPSLACRTTASS